MFRSDTFCKRSYRGFYGKIWLCCDSVFKEIHLKGFWTLHFQDDLNELWSAQLLKYWEQSSTFHLSLRESGREREREIKKREYVGGSYILEHFYEPQRMRAVVCVCVCTQVNCRNLICILLSYNITLPNHALITVRILHVVFFIWLYIASTSQNIYTVSWKQRFQKGGFTMMPYHFYYYKVFRVQWKYYMDVKGLLTINGTINDNKEPLFFNIILTSCFGDFANMDI